jgi:hypothetical protein
VPLSASRALVYLFLSWSAGDMQDAQIGAFLLRLATAPQRSHGIERYDADCHKRPGRSYGGIRFVAPGLSRPTGTMTLLHTELSYHCPGSIKISVEPT